MQKLMLLVRIISLVAVLSLPLKLAAGDTNNRCLPGYTYHIVILGSSTAAGAGPSHADSTWVNRYRHFIRSINPQNQVTNLAQGGTTTYHIMPDWFTAPTGRPARNTTRNVSEAIRLQADAIIVNMPSNDAALGFSLSEQMFNFHTIVSTADSAGIPVWVCTTQPRNFSAVKKQLQMTVRDSILSQFGLRAIDFWTGFADTTGGLDTTYDSGDGVHMNDRAHRVLFQRVQAKNILTALTDTLSKPDHFITELGHSALLCGSSEDSLWVKVSNRGIAGGYKLPIRWHITELSTGLSSSLYDTLANGVSTCAELRRTISLNTSAGGSWQLSAHLETVNDSITSNDHSDTIIIQRYSPPALFTQDLSVCKGDSATLWASGSDTTLWLNYLGGIIGYGDTLKYGILYAGDSVVARSVQGDLHYNTELFTHNNSNVDWNGIMFDLIAGDTIQLDSLALRPSQLARSMVTARYRNGSYKSFETDATAWTWWGTDSVQPVALGELATAHFGTITLFPGDTLGLYLSMQNGRSLKYASQGQEASYTKGPLTLMSGTGITYGFAGTYFPRAWSGTVYFHHGFNPQGDCFKDTTVRLRLFPDALDLGADTTLAFNQQLILSVPQGFSNILWSTGDTLSSIAVDSSLAGINNSRLVWVQAQDANTCFTEDTIIVNFTSGIGWEERAGTTGFKLYPNPAREQLVISNPEPQNIEVSIQSISGKVLKRAVLLPGENEMALRLPKGIYLIYFKEYPRRTQVLQVY